MSRMIPACCLALALVIAAGVLPAAAQAGPDAAGGVSADAGPGEGGDSAVVEPGKKDFVSVRRKKNPFSFHMAFSIGGIGYGILGPRQARADQYQFMYAEESFMAGFRGGLEAHFQLQKRHCVTAGAFYEQRRVQLKLGDVSLSRVLFPGLTPEMVYFLPLARYVDKSNVDTNYITMPVGYRFFVLDELYIGMSLDVAVLFQAKANYAVLGYTTSLNCVRYLQAVDFGGRAIVGFTMNRVFVEIAIGGGFLDIDRLAGERHTILVNGMVGYRI